MPIANIPKVRTEIVLKDARHVAFWFSFSFRLAIWRQHAGGKRPLSVTHQIQARPKALFPKKRECDENDKFKEGLT